MGIPARQIKIFVCRRCSTEFYFNNKFHKHVKACKTPTQSDTFITKKVNVFHAFIFIQLDVPPNNNPKLNFRFWRYATFAVSINNKQNCLNEICANAGCGVSLVDKTFLFKKIPDYQTRFQKKLINWKTTVMFFSYRGCSYGNNANHEYQFGKCLFF